MAVGDSVPRSRSRRYWVRISPKREVFSKEGTSAGPWMCLHVFQGLTVGWWKEERHSSDTTARSAGFKSQAGWASHGCLCCISCCVIQKGKRRRDGGRGWPGKVHKEKKRGKNKPTARYLIDQYGEKGKAIKKK
jgi:hypothetical protein